MLITTGMVPGWPGHPEICNEIIDLSKPEAICDPLPNVPIDIAYAVGGKHRKSKQTAYL